MVRVGRALRPLTPTPGLLNRATFWLFLRNGPKRLPATAVEHEVIDGEVLPLTGGIRAVHVPGHCAGQLAFLWPRRGGVLFAADAAANVAGLLGLPRPRGPGRGEAQRGEARCVGLRSGLLQPRPGDPARGVGTLQKVFRARPEGNGWVGYLKSCSILLGASALF
jgi:glyoxylase-like metal-dependent hydrolase (beta-lactamase superfamily II)